MSDYREGDLIEGRKGETVIRGRLEKGPSYEGGFRIPNAGWGPAGFERDGFTITFVERGPQPLPTEPGTVIAWRDGAYLPQLAQLDDGPGNFGWRFYNDTGGYWLTDDEMLTAMEGHEFTVLVPKAVS